jgi:SnoaL-like domain
LGLREHGRVTDAERTAREVLAQLQDCVDAKDVGQLGQLMDDDVALVGTASANLDRTRTMAYLHRVVAQEGAIRWEWDQVRPLVSEPGLLCFAAVGTVGLDDGERQPFRLTCVAVDDQGSWRLRHFHGSVPEAE